MIKVEDIAVKLLSYGPKTTLRLDGKEISIEPDILIALEGIGTVKGVSLEERYRDLLSRGKSPERTALKLHEESTRRGHASLTTSLSLQLEIGKCSRASSMLLVAPPFGSYIQESQRRKITSRNEFVIPRKIMYNQGAQRIFEKGINEAYETYKQLIEAGIEIEDARYILPLASATSLFASGSLDTFLGFITDSERFKQDTDIYPDELVVIGNKIRNLAYKVAPMLTKARLSFKTPLPTYPYPNPYKDSDPLMENVLKEVGEVSKLKMLDFRCLIADENLISRVLKDPSKASSLIPFLSAVFLEPLSLAAYHQSIRHRTVPTAVESIYKAIARLIKHPEKSLIIPPKISSSEKLLNIFLESSKSLIEYYEVLTKLDVPLSDAVYLIPQAMKIYVVRYYNAFNLLWPQGYVAMRTCSYSQWEERRIAYEIWNSIAEKDPEIASLMGERCKLLGYCPERKWCEIILKYQEHRRDSQGRV